MRFRDLGIELDLAVLDDAEHGVAAGERVAQREAANARATAAHDAVGGSANLAALQAPLKFAPLRFDLHLLGFRLGKPTPGGRELCFGRLRSHFALIENALGQVLGFCQGARAFELRLRLSDARFHLGDQALGALDRRRGAAEGGIFCGELSFELFRSRGRLGRRPS